MGCRNPRFQVIMLSVAALALIGAFQAPVPLTSSNAVASRTSSDVAMFLGGQKAAPRKAPAKKAPAKKAPAKKAPAKRTKASLNAQSKIAYSTKASGSTFVDVTGKAYVDVDTFIPHWVAGILSRSASRVPRATADLLRWKSSTAACPWLLSLVLSRPTAESD